MNVTVPHRGGPSRSASARRPRSSQSTRASGTLLKLPAIGPAGRYSVASVSSKSSARQKREQRDAELVLEEGVHHVCGVNARETMDVMLKVVAVRRRGPITLRKGKPLWQRVQEIVAAANQEGLRRVHTAVPPDEVRFFFDKSLDLIELPKKPVPGVLDEFVGFHALRNYLIGVTLNNKAFLQQAAGDPPQLVTQTLLRALKVQGAAFSTLTLYNLAVVLVAAQRFDIARDFIACCSEMAEVCLRMAVPGSRGVSTLYAGFRTSVAKHAIMCHHLVAALSAWCGLRDEELYHCHLAVCCAAKYLDAGSAIAARCVRRLAAAQDGSGALMMSEKEPPRLPLLTDDAALVDDALFVVFLREAEALQAPPTVEQCTARLASAMTPSGRLPKIKEKRRAPPRKPSATPLRTRSATPRGRVRSTGKTAKKAKGVPQLSVSAVMESFRRERATTPLCSEGLYSLRSNAGSESPTMVTFVPKPAYDCYKHLRRELRQLIGTLGHNMTRTTSANSPELHESHLISRRESSTTVAPAEPLAISKAPMEYITITDKKLRKLSMLVPDKDFERFEMAVVALQSCWRGIKMRLLYRKCLQLVELTTLRREAAEVIQYAFRNHLATREDILEKKLRREHRLKVERLTLIQRYLYEKQSVEAFGMQCVAAFQRLIAHIAEVRRRYAAAIRLQAFWRMCMTRIRIHRAVAACQRIQAVWRGHLGRLRARELRTRRRLAEQDRIAMLTVRIRPVQRWWRNVLAVRAGRAVVASRQRDVAAYLEAQESAFEVEWGRIKHLPDVELYMLKILAVFRGFRCRLECAHRRKLLHVLRRFLLRIVWKKRGERQLLSLREVHTQTRMLRRRGEEVTDAALRIQCLVRRWLAWRQRRVLWLQLQWRHNQARVIQRAYRRFVGRRVMAAARMEAKLQSEKKLMEHLMHYSAAKIQATWRMYSEYKRKEEYLRGDRHVFATRIQKAWRAYTAQWSAHSRRLSRRDAARAVQEEHYRQVAAIRIQAAARMFLVRQRLRRRGVSLRPTPAMLRLCARRIQCAWRRHAAYEYVQQLRFSRAYYDQAKINMESLYTYATMIQSFVRGRVINPKIVAARRLEVEQDIIENKKRRGDVIRGTRAVITIQKNLHRVLERRPEPVLPSPEATSEWASDFAPAVASASTAAALPRAVVPVVMSIPAVALAAPPVEPAAPICVTSMTPADATASTTRGEGGVVMTLETAVPLLQRCGRSCLARRDVQTALFAHPRWRSAIDVQRVWRGYRSRQVVEVYYEYCEEEEDEEVSAEGGSFAEGGSL